MTTTVRKNIQVELPENELQKLQNRIKNEIAYYAELLEYEKKLQEFIAYVESLRRHQEDEISWNGRALLKLLKNEIEQLQIERADDSDTGEDDETPSFSYWDHGDRSGDTVTLTITTGEERINGEQKLELRLLRPHEGLVVLCNNPSDEDWEYTLAIGFKLDASGISDVIYDCDFDDGSEDITVGYVVMEALEEAHKGDGRGDA